MFDEPPRGCARGAPEQRTWMAERTDTARSNWLQAWLDCDLRHRLEVDPCLLALGDHSVWLYCGDAIVASGATWRVAIDHAMDAEHR